MSKINHEFFGEIDINKNSGEESGTNFIDGVKVLWEEEYKGIITTLWYDSGYEFKVEILDIFGKFLNNRENYVNNAKLALVNYLKEDNEYLTFHKEELEMDVPGDISKFVEMMQVNAIALWAGENFIAIDFMIDADESDQILCVKFNDQLEVESVDWES